MCLTISKLATSFSQFPVMSPYLANQFFKKKNLSYWPKKQVTKNRFLNKPVQLVKDKRLLKEMS